MPKSATAKSASDERENPVSMTEHRKGSGNGRRVKSVSHPKDGSLVPAKKNNQAVTATNLILQRLSELDSRVTGLADQHVIPTLHVSESLNKQTQAIVDVAEAMKSLQCSLVSAVSDAIEDRLRQQQSNTTAPMEHSAEAKPVAASDEAAAAKNDLPQSTWDDIRSQFLAHHGEGEAADLSEEESTVHAKQPIELPEQEPEPLLPEFVTIADPDSLNEDELRSAVIDQERTIAILAKRLQQQSRKSQILTAEQLTEVIDILPEQLATRATESLNALDRQLRYGELELSLERARVSRQASRLEVARERLEARARAMGLEIAEDGSIEGGSKTAARGSKARNWLGAMGFGN